MAPAEVETFIVGKGSSFETVQDPKKTFKLVSTIVEISEHILSGTQVEVSGIDLQCVVRGNDSLVSSNVTLDLGKMRTFLSGKESIEVNEKRTLNRIKVTNTPKFS